MEFMGMIKIKNSIFLVGFWMMILVAWSGPASGQSYNFTKADTLRGTLSGMRSCYDVTYYDLQIKIDPEEQALSGYNRIDYDVVTDFTMMQVDLFENMNIDKIVFEKKELPYTRAFNAVFIEFPETQVKGSKGSVYVYYNGKPQPAVRPPWDGGFVWQKDKFGTPWIGVACEGTGASLWWPNKDHLSDEPDSMRTSYTVPSNLVCVGNGRLISKEKVDKDWTTYVWAVSYPINNYNISVNIADYVHFNDIYTRNGETLALDYYVLAHNEEKAQKHFRQVKPMLECYEKHFGAYPFSRDGYALVETPYWGMEHQGAIAYGNNYANNKFGFDFIIIHETGHEWWGNSLSVADHAEMWIHESFCTYAEAVYVECSQGYDQMIEYLESQRPRIVNQQPIIGPLGVNYGDWGDADMYFKGSWMLHSIRNTIDNDSLWYAIIYGLAEEMRISIVNTDQVINYINQKAGIDLTPIFNQYLREIDPPVLQYKLEQKAGVWVISYKWEAKAEGFNMPVLIGNDKAGWTRIKPTNQWQSDVMAGLVPGTLKFSKHLFYFITEQVDK